MSHYSVAVFTDPKGATVEELLAPYDENICVPRYLYKTKAQIIADERQDNRNADKTDEEIYQHELQYYDEDMIDPDTGAVYSTYNPDSKWDWWSVGGRFGAKLLSKSNHCLYDYLPVSDIDFDAMRQNDLEDLTPYQEFIDGDHFFKKEYLLALYPDEETYIRKVTEFSTFAVLTPDGEWHEEGEMGWFGCSSETPEEDTAWRYSYYEIFIKPAIANGWELTIVDCHI